MVLLSSLSRWVLPLLLSTLTKGSFIERQTAATTGDRFCGSNICVSATLNGSTVEYVLESTGKRTVGWMGVGWGRQMAFTPMVIMWPNSDGSVTLSQRSAPSEQQPTVDSNPPRVASVYSAATVTSGSTPRLAFTIPADSDSKPYLIYAFGDVNPGSSAVDADLQQHYENGQNRLDLTKSLSTSTTTGSGSSSTGTTNSGGSNSATDDIPLLPYQRLIVAHAIFCVVGFLLLLPGGALLARYLRTYTPTWFTGHWIAQLGLAGPAIIIGVGLGIKSVSKAGALHLNDTHKKLGVALFVLYIVQCAVGAYIHFVKRPGATRRPLQNYFHAVLGLAIIGLAMYQVRSGCHDEWPQSTGRGPLPMGVNIVYIIWIVVVTVLYFAGLLFLPKQLRQEKEARHKIPAKYEETDEHEQYDLQYRDRD